MSGILEIDVWESETWGNDCGGKIFVEEDSVEIWELVDALSGVCESVEGKIESWEGKDWLSGVIDGIPKEELSEMLGKTSVEIVSGRVWGNWETEFCIGLDSNGFDIGWKGCGGEIKEDCTGEILEVEEFWESKDWEKLNGGKSEGWENEGWGIAVCENWEKIGWWEGIWEKVDGIGVCGIDDVEELGVEIEKLPVGTNVAETAFVVKIVFFKKILIWGKFTIWNTYKTFW